MFRRVWLCIWSFGRILQVNRLQMSWKVLTTIQPSIWPAIQRLPAHNCCEWSPLSRRYNRFSVKATTTSNEKPEVHTWASARVACEQPKCSSRRESRCLAWILLHNPVCSLNMKYYERADRVLGFTTIKAPQNSKSSKRAKSQAFFAAGHLEGTWMSLVTSQAF